MHAMTLTAKVRLLPDEGQAALFRATMKAYRKGCDVVSSRVDESRCLKQRALHDATYALLRGEVGLRSQMAQSVVKTVIARYKAILESTGEWKRPRFRRPQLDLVWNRDYSLRADGTFSVNTLEGRAKVPFETKGMERWFGEDRIGPAEGVRFGTARLVERHGKFFLHVPVTFDAPDCPPSAVREVVGVDRGINFTVAAYDSKGRTRLVSGRATKQKRASCKRVREELQRKKTPSARRRLKRIGRRENRWMQDVNHCIAKALVAEHPSGTLFVLEDLSGVRSATERVRKHDRYTQVSWSFYDLGQKLKYKAEQSGSLVIEVDPAYTSQCCPKCGHTERANRDKRRHEFRCKSCGWRSNDDRAAAMNLHRKGIEWVEAHCSVPGAV